MVSKRVIPPDYVRQGSCSDCLKVWAKERDALLRQIDALERQLAAQKVVNRQRAARLALHARGETSTSRSKEEPNGYPGEEHDHDDQVKDVAT